MCSLFIQFCEPKVVEQKVVWKRKHSNGTRWSSADPYPSNVQFPLVPFPVTSSLLGSLSSWAGDFYVDPKNQVLLHLYWTTSPFPPWNPSGNKKRFFYSKLDRVSIQEKLFSFVDSKIDMSDCAYQFDDVLSTDAHWIRGFPSQQCLTPEGTIMIPCPWQSHIVDGESISIFPRISSFVHGLTNHFQFF